MYQFQSCFNLIQNVLLQRRSFDELSFVKESDPTQMFAFDYVHKVHCFTLGMFFLAHFTAWTITFRNDVANAHRGSDALMSYHHEYKILQTANVKSV